MLSVYTDTHMHHADFSMWTTKAVNKDKRSLITDLCWWTKKDDGNFTTGTSLFSFFAISLSNTNLPWFFNITLRCYCDHSWALSSASALCVYPGDVLPQPTDSSIFRQTAVQQTSTEFHGTDSTVDNQQSTGLLTRMPACHSVMSVRLRLVPVLSAAWLQTLILPNVDHFKHLLSWIDGTLPRCNDCPPYLHPLWLFGGVSFLTCAHLFVSRITLAVVDEFSWNL